MEPKIQERSIGKKVLISTLVGGHLPSLTTEYFIGHALYARGAVVDFLICDELLPACMMCEMRQYGIAEKFIENGNYSNNCARCYMPAKKKLDRLRAKTIKLGEYITNDERIEAASISKNVTLDKIRQLVLNNIPVGEHAYAGAIRFYACGELPKTSEGEKVLRLYLESALLTYFAMSGLMRVNTFEVVVINHGIYVPQGVAVDVAREFGCRIVTWHQAYREGCFIFNHEITYHKGMIDESTETWSHLELNNKQKDDIKAYLTSRKTGKHDWINFVRKPVFGIDFLEKFGIDLNKPIIGLLTNVAWDAQLHYQNKAFDNMYDWILETISYFSQRHDLQLLIRIHPAELVGSVPTNQPMYKEILKAYPNGLPKNVFVIDSDNSFSTYDAMSVCNSVIIYGTKMGVEIAAEGKPVIVAGEAWIKNKGFTIDPQSREKYLEILDQLPIETVGGSLGTDAALKYAYHFFFRRMIPLKYVFREKNSWPPFNFRYKKIDDLMIGRSHGLDVICDGILNGEPFIYPAEKVGYIDY